MGGEYNQFLLPTEKRWLPTGTSLAEVLEFCKLLLKFHLEKNNSD